MSYETFSVKISFRCFCQLYVAKSGQYRKMSIMFKITVYYSFQTTCTFRRLDYRSPKILLLNRGFINSQVPFKTGFPILQHGT